VATAESVWRQAKIQNYALDIAVDEFMTCGGPEPLRYSVVVTERREDKRDGSAGRKAGYAPTVEDLFRMIEVTEPNGSSVTYTLRASSTFTMEHLRDAATKEGLEVPADGNPPTQGLPSGDRSAAFGPSCGEASAPGLELAVLPNTHGRGGSP
jgi:hypothetical protein